MSKITAAVPSLPEEMRRLFKLFWPIVLGQLAQTSMGVVDTVMAGAAGTEQLGGVAVGASFFWPAVLFLVGLSIAISPITAQLRGAGLTGKIPQKLHCATVICLIASVLVAALEVMMPAVYRLMPNTDPVMIKVATGYLIAVAVGIPGFTAFNILRSYWEGLGHTLPTFVFGLIALCLNIPLNYIFIFGKLGAPALGGIGCGVATTVTIYVTVILMLIYVKKAPFFANCRLYARLYPLKKQEISDYLKLGLPLGLSITAEVACFSLVAFLLTPFGAQMVAAHSIAMNLSGLLFIFPLSLGSAATVRVGAALGGGSWERAARTVHGSLSLGLVIYAVFVALVLLNRDLIVHCYTKDEAVFAIASILLIINCGYFLADSIQAICLGILRGFKDSRTIFIITVFSYWGVGMPLGLILCYGAVTQPFEVYGFWIGFFASLSLCAICYALRIRYLFSRKILPKAMQTGNVPAL